MSLSTEKLAIDSIVSAYSFNNQDSIKSKKRYVYALKNPHLAQPSQ
jgi:hypothetical protein